MAKPEHCIKCNRKTLPRKMRFDGICHACCYYHSKHGTYERKIVRRTQAMGLSVCQNCRVRPIKYFRGGKYLCKRCGSYHYQHNRHRPRHMDLNNCKVCGRPLEKTYTGNNGGKGRCHTCASYWRNHGKERSERMIKAQAPHGWCECGKPATKQIDLRTGALYVHPTLTGTNDAIKADSQEWAEWVCDECAGFEAEMQHIDGNEYRPGALIARE